jgi:hypothetical protein
MRSTMASIALASSAVKNFHGPSLSISGGDEGRPGHVFPNDGGARQRRRSGQRRRQEKCDAGSYDRSETSFERPGLCLVPIQRLGTRSSGHAGHHQKGLRQEGWIVKTISTITCTIVVILAISSASPAFCQSIPKQKQARESTGEANSQHQLGAQKRVARSAAKCSATARTGWVIPSHAIADQRAIAPT